MKDPANPHAATVASAAGHLEAFTNNPIPAHPRKGPWWPSPWGESDERGALNHLGPHTALAAAGLIRSGEIIDLSLPLRANYPDSHGRNFTLASAGAPSFGPLGEGRWVANDELIAGRFTGMATHFNALVHVGKQIGDPGNSNSIHYYNGFSQTEIGSPWGFRKMGVETVPPLFTRGILIDLTVSRGGRPNNGSVLTVEDFQAALAHQGMSDRDILPGDALFWSVGNADLWFTDAKAYVAGTPGIESDTAAWIAAKGVAVVGFDSYTAEASPRTKDNISDVHGEFLCIRGVHMIINLHLTELARRRVYRFAFSCTTMPFVGAQGSPVRPFAIV